MIGIDVVSTGKDAVIGDGNSCSVNVNKFVFSWKFAPKLENCALKEILVVSFYGSPVVLVVNYGMIFNFLFLRGRSSYLLFFLFFLDFVIFFFGLLSLFILS